MRAGDGDRSAARRLSQSRVSEAVADRAAAGAGPRARVRVPSLLSTALLESKHLGHKPTNHNSLSAFSSALPLCSLLI